MATVPRFAAGLALVCLIGSECSDPLVAQELQSIPVETVGASPIADLPSPLPVTLADAALAPSRNETPVSTTAGPSLKLSAEAFGMTAHLDTARAPAWLTTPVFAPAEFSAMGQRGYYGRGRGRNGAAQAEIVLGAIATIAGSAVLVYANRPDCSTHPMTNGCGYGTKVVGTAVLSAGVVSLIVGALTWR